jgi:hypothetical protein
MVIKLLQAAARDAGATVVSASHDPDLISAADTSLMLGSYEERALRGELPVGRSSGASTAPATADPEIADPPITPPT